MYGRVGFDASGVFGIQFLIILLIILVDLFFLFVLFVVYLHKALELEYLGCQILTADCCVNVSMLPLSLIRNVVLLYDMYFLVSI